MKLDFGQGLARINGENGRVCGVETTDGRVRPADIVVFGIGVLPNVAIAAEAGLDIENGIKVDAELLTSDPTISAIGDCASFPSSEADLHIRLESVQNAADQGRNVAARLLGKPSAYAAVPWFWSDQRDLKRRSPACRPARTERSWSATPTSAACRFYASDGSGWSRSSRESRLRPCRGAQALRPRRSDAHAA